MREIPYTDIVDAVRMLCIQANTMLSPDLRQAIRRAGVTEAA